MTVQLPPWSGRYSQRITAACLAEYGDRCTFCDQPGSTTADHVIPRSLGGTDELANLRPAHKLCNQLRGRQPITDELRAYIRARVVAAPSRVDSSKFFDGW